MLELHRSTPALGLVSCRHEQREVEQGVSHDPCLRFTLLTMRRGKHCCISSSGDVIILAKAVGIVLIS